MQTILAIESSCDETAAAVVRGGNEVLSSVIYSQVPLHQPYGGVVPEIASRSHIEKIRSIVEQALAEAFPGEADPWSRIDAIAATRGPGLAASLLVGWSAAKGLALAAGKPLLPIHHIHAHLHSVYLDQPLPPQPDDYPQLALAVSGGHTCILAAKQPHAWKLLGQTIDDAAGEALDKAAKLLNLGYPGGPVIDKRAKVIPVAQRKTIPFPQGRLTEDHPLPPGLSADLCLSFSGLKTSLLTYVQKHPPQNDADIDQICACYQEAVVDALVKRLDKALQRNTYKTLAVGGGVSLNSRLRERLATLAQKHQVKLLLASPKYCGDNAAMIAGLAAVGGAHACENALALDIDPSMEL
ncbi:MAG: tRNA (adenosine(37)-N6)-threonylcarbamoyltransferase complex transferase subunit TsaD [bacterium]|nr:tRNA (adenosine(37)-N6)-threonylcarbamoyltransferase complex transferase subunit TsaD [bacterium]